MRVVDPGRARLAARDVIRWGVACLVVAGLAWLATVVALGSMAAGADVVGLMRRFPAPVSIGVYLVAAFIGLGWTVSLVRACAELWGWWLTFPIVLCVLLAQQLSGFASLGFAIFLVAKLHSAAERAEAKAGVRPLT